MTHRALITGVNGQDGSYLAEMLLSKGYQVVGTTRSRPTMSDFTRLRQIPKGVDIVEGDLTGDSYIESLLHRFRPHEVYNLAARASSSDLWTNPTSTGDVNALLVVRLLDAIHRLEDHPIRFLQASSSEVFGRTTETPQVESTPFQPRNPYGVAKAFGHWITAVYRKERGIFASSCILYNHESPRRGMEFVTRKISRGVAMIKLGLAEKLRLGNLDARRDWGFAGDYVQAMWLALQQTTPDDYIVATGETHSVGEFCEVAFSHVGLRYEDYVESDRENLRPLETSVLVGDPAKAKRVLGWRPTVSFEELVVMMVDSDLLSLEIDSGGKLPLPG